MIADPRKEFYKNYALSNGKMHLFRFINTNFGSKWAGLWMMDKKFLDYWAYKVDGKWLSMHNCMDFEHTGWSVIHTHDVNDLKISEEVVPIDDGFISLLKIRNHGDSKKEIEIDFEVGVNIRHRSEDLHKKSYDVKQVRDLVRVSQGKEKIYFGSLDGNFRKDCRYSEHNPGEYANYCGYVTESGVGGTWNECLQSKFVPGVYTLAVSLNPDEEKEIPFFFSEGKLTGRRKYKEWIEKSKKDYEKIRDDMKNFENSSLIDNLVSSIYSFRTKGGFLAGYPFFNEIWTRDACWSVPGYLYLGLTGEVKEFLQNLSTHIRDGKVPGLVNSKKCLYNSSDASPLWIISLYRYLDFTGDSAFSRSMAGKVKEVMDYGRSRIKENLVDDFGYSWMDSMNRERPVDVQAMWARAFYCGGMILHRNGRNATKYFDTSSNILQEIEKRYWKKEIIDNLGKDFKSPNFVFQLALMHINKNVDKHLSKLMDKDYLTPVGIRSRPSSEKGYNPKGYHTGCVWPFITMSAALANCNYEKTGNVKMLMDINTANFGKQCVNGINEIFESDDYMPLGCTSQAWSVAGILEIIDSYFLGIIPKLTENMIIIDPSKFDFNHFERKIRIGRRKVVLNYKKKENILEMEVENLPVVGKIPNVYKKCMLNGKVFTESVIVLKPKKKHTLVLEF